MYAERAIQLLIVLPRLDGRRVIDGDTESVSLDRCGTMEDIGAAR